jgi:hypothetical protein
LVCSARDKLVTCSNGVDAPTFSDSVDEIACGIESCCATAAGELHCWGDHDLDVLKAAL